jgi:hypothetical protein
MDSSPAILHIEAMRGLHCGGRIMARNFILMLLIVGMTIGAVGCMRNPVHLATAEERAEFTGPGRPSGWRDTRPYKVSYYYYPRYGVYEMIGRREWLWQNGDTWTWGRVLPADLRYEDLGERVVVDLGRGDIIKYHPLVEEVYPGRPRVERRDPTVRLAQTHRYRIDHEHNRLRDMDLTRDYRHFQQR